jgi:hypothetical protein
MYDDKFWISYGLQGGQSKTFNSNNHNFGPDERALMIFQVFDSVPTKVSNGSQLFLKESFYQCPKRI